MKTLMYVSEGRQTTDTGLGLGLAKCPAAQGPEVSAQQHAGFGPQWHRQFVAAKRC